MTLLSDIDKYIYKPLSVLKQYFNFQLVIEIFFVEINH